MNSTENNRNLKLSLFFLIIVFLITRLPFYLYYPVVSISFDTASYCAVALNILEGNIPLFDIRTPGYPFFLSAIWMFSKNLFFLSLVQSLFTLFSCVLFLVVVNRVYKKHLIYFAAALIIYISSSYFILFESAMLTENLFVNVLILITAFMILAIKERSSSHWILFSVLCGVLLYLRPAGLFLAPVFAVLFFYFFKSKLNLKYYSSLLAPVMIFILSLCMYNYFTVNSFSMSPFGNINLPGVTITFMEPSPEYPEYVNQIIDSVSNKLPGKDKSYVRTSFGVSKLYNVFLNNFYAVIVLTGMLMQHESSSGFISVIPILKRISFDAIKKHPDIYAKFFISNFIQFFRNISKSLVFYTELERIYKSIAIEQKHLKALEKGGWQQVSTNASDYQKVIDLYRMNAERTAGIEQIKIEESDKVKLNNTALKSIYDFYEKVYNILFRNIFWLIISAITFAVCFIKLLKSNFRNTDALIYFLLVLMFISKAVLVSLVESSLERYSFTIEFVLYLSIPYLIILWNKTKTKKE